MMMLGFEVEEIFPGAFKILNPRELDLQQFVSEHVIEPVDVLCIGTMPKYFCTTMEATKRLMENDASSVLQDIVLVAV